MGATGVSVYHGSPIPSERREAIEKNTPSVWGRVVRVVAPIMAVGGIVAACLVNGGLFIGLSAAAAVVGGVASAYFLYQKVISDRHISLPQSYPQANAVPASAAKATGTGKVPSTAAGPVPSATPKPVVMQPPTISTPLPGKPGLTTPVPDNSWPINPSPVVPEFSPAQDPVGIPGGPFREAPSVSKGVEDSGELLTNLWVEFMREHVPDDSGLKGQNLPQRSTPAVFKSGEEESTTTEDSPSHTGTSFTSVLCKNEFKNEDQPFTKVQMTNGQWVELLNTVPEEVARKICPQRPAFSKRRTGHVMSEGAISSLRIQPNDIADKSKSCLFGEGAYGVVKFARLGDSDEIVAAKKITHYDEVDAAAAVEKEARIQTQAGDSALAVHGVAHRKNRKGKNQSVIFMEIATGTCLNRFDLHKFDRQQRSELALLLLKKVSAAIKKRCFHLDLEWHNVLLDTDNFKSSPRNLKLIDFGIAEESEQMEATYSYERIGSLKDMPTLLTVRIAPELVVQSEKVNSEKVVVWELGRMILDLFKKNSITEHAFDQDAFKWYPPGNDEKNQKVYNDCVRKVFSTTYRDGFDPKFARYLPAMKKMLAYDPKDRMGIEEAVKTFEKLVAQG